MIFTTMVRGTASRAPTGPHTQPQKMRERMTTRVERPRRRPRRFGSMRFPKPRFTTTYPAPTMRACPIPNWMRPRRTAGAEAIIDPMVGT